MPVNIRFSESMIASLESVAEVEGGLSMSDTVRLVIERGLEASRKKGT